MKKSIPLLVSTVEDINIESNIIFSNYSNLVKEKKTKEGFTLNILVVGRRGLGCKTLINSIFSSPIIKQQREDLETFTCQLYENEVCLNLTTTTTHKMNKESIENFINDRYISHFQKEQGLVKKKFDERIHVCVFLIPNDNITQNEIEIMEMLSQKVNLVPVIAKSDSYTLHELSQKKNEIKNLLKAKKINVFTPDENETKDYEVSNEILNIVTRFPLAVTSSEEIIIKNDISIRVRKYPWGSIDIEGEPTNDFLTLRKILIGFNLIDLIYETETVFYNNFRYEMICSQKNDKEAIKKRLNLIRIELEKLLMESIKEENNDETRVVEVV